MRDYARFPPRWWTERNARSMRGKPNLQVVAMYLCTSPNSNMIGLYYLPVPMIEHETGVTGNDLAMAMQRLSELKYSYYDRTEELVYLPNMAPEQIGEKLTDKQDAMVKGVTNILEKFEGHDFTLDFVARYGTAYRLSMDGHQGVNGQSVDLSKYEKWLSVGGDLFAQRPTRDQDQDQEKDQEKEQAKGGRAPAPAPARSETHAITRFNPATLCRLFGEIRSREVGGLPWQNVRVANGRDQSMCDMLNADQASVADVEPSMVLFFKRAKEGRAGQRSGEILKEPSLAFASWCSSFTSLREEMLGKTPAVPAAAKPKTAEPFAVASERRREEEALDAAAETVFEQPRPRRTLTPQQEWQAEKARREQEANQPKVAAK